MILGDSVIDDILQKVIYNSLEPYSLFSVPCMTRNELGSHIEYLSVVISSMADNYLEDKNITDGTLLSKREYVKALIEGVTKKLEQDLSAQPSDFI